MKMRINTGSSCRLCDDIILNSSLICNSGTAVVIRWSNIYVLTLYFVEIVISFAVFLCLLYFWKNRNSPLVKSCYSCPDNVIMTVLYLFCFLPMMHVGELSPKRCMFLSPVVNVVFAFYTGLLLTKTLSLQNLLKCQTVSANPDRRMAFCVFVVIFQVIILVTLPFSGFPNIVRFSCRGGVVVTLCDIQGNLSVLSCMLYNWICLFVLSCISVVEALKQRCQVDFRRTENLAAVSLVGFFSYTILTSCAYFNLQLENYMLVTLLILYVVYLINPVVCLTALYLPTIHRIRVCLRQQRNFQLKSKVMSPRRKSSAIEILFSYLVKSNFGPEQPPLTRSSHSSGVSHLSYPSSLVCGVRESICIVTFSGVGHARTGCESFYDNVPRVVAVKENCMSSFAGQGISTVEPRNEDYDGGEDPDIELTYEELKELFSILKGLRSSDV